MKVGSRRAAGVLACASALIGALFLPAMEGAAAADGGTGQKHCGAPVNGVFEKATPEEVGLSRAELQKASAFAQSRATLSFRVYRNGCEVFVGPYDALVQDLPRNNFSHTKTVLALAALRAQQLGLIDIDKPISAYVPEKPAEVQNPKVLDITTRHILEMSSGIHTGYVWGGEQLAPDGIKQVYGTPIDHPQGTFWEYNQPPLNLVPYVIEGALGGKVDFQDWVQQNLFGPLGIKRDSWFWLRDRIGYTLGAYHLFSSPRHMALIAALMRGQGTVGDKVLISKSVFANLTKPLSDIGQESYGLLTWLNSGESYKTVGTICTGDDTVDRPMIASAPRDMFFSYGWRGIHSYAIPSLDMAVVQTTLPDAVTMDVADTAQSVCSVEQGEFYHEFWRKVSAAVVDQPQPDPGPWENPQPVRMPFDPALFTDLVYNGDLSRATAVGPWAPTDCTPVGCDGKIYYAGYAKLSQEAINAVSASVVRTVINVANDPVAAASAGLSADLLSQPLAGGDLLGGVAQPLLGDVLKGAIATELPRACKEFRAGHDAEDVVSKSRARLLGNLPQTLNAPVVGNAFSLAVADALPAFCTAP